MPRICPVRRSSPASSIRVYASSAVRSFSQRQAVIEIDREREMFLKRGVHNQKVFYLSSINSSKSMSSSIALDRSLLSLCSLAVLFHSLSISLSLHQPTTHTNLFTACYQLPLHSISIQQLHPSVSLLRWSCCQHIHSAWRHHSKAVLIEQISGKWKR